MKTLNTGSSGAAAVDMVPGTVQSGCSERYPPCGLSFRGMIGNCKLCLSPGVTLRDSHIIPKWAYRRASDGPPDPLVFRDEKFIQTSKQAKEYLLCEACEQRLSLDERYVAKLAYQVDGKLGLEVDSGVVFPVPHPEFGPHSRGASISGLDCLSMARFAASMFWRGHVARKEPLGGLKLWNPQAEALRRFVLREKSLPDRMCLHLVVLTDGAENETVHSTTTIAPCSAKHGENGFHQFVVAGLLFNLSMGTDWAGICLACGRNPHVIFQDWQSVRLVTSATKGMIEARRS